MTSPDEQARTLRGAIEAQRAAEQAGRDLARDIALDRMRAEETETAREE